LSSAQLEVELKVLSLTLLHVLCGQSMDRTPLQLSALWPVTITLGARAIVLSALLEGAEAGDVELAHLLSAERCAGLMTSHPLSGEQRQALRAWLNTWAPEAIEPLLSSPDFTEVELGATVSLSARPSVGLPALLQGLGESYEQLIGLSPQKVEGEDHRLELVEGGLRQVNGSYYTPPWLITHILTLTLDQVAQGHPPTIDAPLSLLDPACGVGRFLAQGALRQAELIGETRAGDTLATLISRAVYGVDLDPHAVELCRGWLWALGDLNEEESALLSAHIRCGDALLRIPPHDGALQEPLAHWRLSFPERVVEGRALFDVIIGNPPYIDSEQMKRHSPELRASLCERFKSCKGNWDLFVPFVELSMGLLDPLGAQAMVTPKTLIGADYASSIQALLLQRRLTHLIDCRRCEVFQDANVEVLVLVARGEAFDAQGDAHITLCAPDPQAPLRVQLREPFPQRALRELPAGHWGFALSDLPEQQALFELWRTSLKVGDVARISDGATTSEAYLLKELIQEAPAELLSRSTPSPKGLVALVNTGLIDPYVSLWGQRKARYLKSDWSAPTLSLTELQRRFPRRAEQALSAKVLVAGLARRVEAVVAPPGVLCGKSARQLIPTSASVCVYALCAILNSQLIHQLYGALFGLRGLSRSWSLGSRQLSALPVPSLIWLTPCEEDPLLSQEQLIREEWVARASQEAHDWLSCLGQALHRWPHEPILHELLERAISERFQRVS